MLSLLIFIIVSNIVTYMFFQLRQKVFFFFINNAVIINLTIISAFCHNYIIQIALIAEFIEFQPLH